MIGPELQKGIYDALVAAAVAGGRIYDNPPKQPTFPYVTIGDEQLVSDGDDAGGCDTGDEVSVDVHVWSRPGTGSKAQAKTLAAAAVAALRTVSVSGHAVTLAEPDTVRTFRDPDGVTEHSVITFTYHISRT